MPIARSVRWLLTTGLLLVAYFLVPVSTNARGGLPLRIVVAVLLFGAAAGLVLVQVRQAVVNPARQVDGLVISLTVVWVLFSLAFYIMAEHQPTQVSGLHTRVDALYFTAATLLTIGYGDIYAAGQAARVLAMIQMLFDVVFVAGAAQVLTQQVRSRAVRRVQEAAANPESHPRRRILRKER